MEKKSNSTNLFQHFRIFEEGYDKQIVFCRNYPGVLEVWHSNNFWITEQYKEIDEFYYKIQDGILGLIESKPFLNEQNLSKLEFLCFNKMKQTYKNFNINDSDKNLGASMAEKEDVINTWKKQK